NGEFGTAEWQPIVYQFQNLSPEELVSLFMAADVSLVTPLRDGMNLVAKEYIAAQVDHPGMLILSEMAGAADEFPEALLVNPNDTKAIAKAIVKALTMSDNARQTRVNAMQKRIRDFPIQRWGSDYLAALKSVREQQQEAKAVTLAGEHLKGMCRSFETAKQRVFLLDYDGTLQEFKPTPDIESAAPDKELHALIQDLASNPRNKVCIISGRSKDALESWFGDTDAQLIAEHGAWVRREKSWHKRDLDFEAARQAIEPVLLDYTSRTPGSRIEQKDFASVWHYRNVPIYLARVRAYNILSELRAAIADDSIGVYSGQKIIEIKPRAVSKRNAVEMVLSGIDPDFIIAMGDDYTDEDMFEAAGNNAYTVKVGSGETNAQYRLVNVSSVHRLLKKLADPNGCSE
ncbi:trehalose-phosphatase, partial [Candidatus Saccharibacteria bacterium]|nr:trehalose-phosphatase [Candidatus Saccharibacteria bacterium]